MKNSDANRTPVWKLDVSAKGCLLFTGLANERNEVEFRRTDGTPITCKRTKDWVESNHPDFEPFRVYDKWNGRFIV